MEQNKTIALYKIALFLLGILFILSFFKCGNDKPIKSVSKNIDTIYVYSLKADSIEVIRNKLVTKWHTKRDTINIHDTIQVIQALNLCDTIILTDSLEIAFLRTINRNFAKVVYNDSLVIDSLKRSKKKYFRGLKHGIIIGAGVTALGVGAIIH